MANELWPDGMSLGMAVFDFDKTITAKHTRGAIWISDHLQPDVLRKNFASLSFFQELIPLLHSKGCRVCVATFADSEDGALASGVSLVRAYLDAALENSRSIIPDENIEAWNPDNRSMDPKRVGKNKHLENLCKRLLPTVKKKDVALFDDTEANVALASMKGYRAHFVPAAEIDEDTGVARNGLSREIWMEFLRAPSPSPTGGCVAM